MRKLLPQRFTLLGAKVIPDGGIASMYEIDRKVLKQAVRRNIKKISGGFYV